MSSTRQKCAAYMYCISMQSFVFLTPSQLVIFVKAQAGDISTSSIKSLLANYDQGGVVAQLVKSQRQGENC